MSFERQFSPQGRTGTLAAEARELSAEEQHRDVYNSHRHRVFSIAFYMTANELEAEQILTSTFVEVFSGGGPRSGHRVDEALLGQLSERFLLQAEASAVADPELLLARVGRQRTALEEALPALTPLERLVFLFHDVEGYTPARIAPLVKQPEGEVRRTLISARIRMRNELAVAQLRAQEAARSAAVADGEAREEQESEEEAPA